MAKAKYRAGLRERLGRIPPALLRHIGAKRTIWVHAVSVGEVLAVSRLVQGLDAELDARAHHYGVVVSTTTYTGQQLARERFGAERCFYFPLDLPWVVRRYRRALKPAILVLAESEFWPNVLAQFHRAGLPVMVVNGRISDRSLPRYLRLRWLWRPFLRALSSVLAQSDEDAVRFVAIGVPRERVHASDNLKFDVRTPTQTAIVASLRATLPQHARVLVCGSTLEGEEALLLTAWTTVRAEAPDAVMILAPRHPERFARVAELLQQGETPWVRRSEWAQSPAPLAPGSVFLLDSIGELAAVYALGTLAFVGGSLVPAGGHNPLEPAQFGVGIVMGEHYENFRGIVKRFLEREAIRLAKPAELAAVLTHLLSDARTAELLGARALEVSENETGATERAVRGVLALLSAPTAAEVR